MRFSLLTLPKHHNNEEFRKSGIYTYNFYMVLEELNGPRLNIIYLNEVLT